jgi:hypothetical protein
MGLGPGAWAQAQAKYLFFKYWYTPVQHVYVHGFHGLKNPTFLEVPPKR